MVHIFDEVGTCTPVDPNEAAPEAIMPQAAWEALLCDAVQGLRPPYTPQALRQWLQATHPQAWAIGAPPPTHHHHTGKGKGTGKGRARDGKRHSGKGSRRGPKWGAGARRDRAHKATQRGGRKPPDDQEGAGAETEAQRKRRPQKAPRPTPRKGIPQQTDQRRPTPGERRTAAGDAHPQHAPPKQESDAVQITAAYTHQPLETTRGMEGTRTRGEQATPTEETAANTAARRTTTPSPPDDDPGRHKGHHTGTGRGRRQGHSTQG